MEYFNSKKKSEEKISLKDSFHMIENLKEINQIKNIEEKNDLIIVEFDISNVVKVIKILNKKIL